MLRGIGFANVVLVFAASCVSCTSDSEPGGKEGPVVTVDPAVPQKDSVTKVSPPAPVPEPTEKPAPPPAITEGPNLSEDPISGLAFAANAFPPTVPDTKWHRDAWYDHRCLRCHETGVEDAPELKHEGLPEVLVTAACRTCHVLIPGSQPRAKPAEPEVALPFAANAFPPMIPSSASHKHTWTRDDCMMCHETGTHEAPIVRHEGLPRLLLKAKCRTCHVQVRAVVSSSPD